MIGTTTRTPPAPTLRRLPVPVCEPPYDDEVPGRAGAPSAPADGSSADAVQGTLALAFVLPSGVPTSPQAPPELHLVPPLRPDAEADLDDAEFGPQPTARRDLPEPHGWSGRFAQAVVEVLAGDRPVAQLVRWTTAEVFDQLASLVLDAASGGVRSPRAVVRSVRVTEPADGVAEVAAMVRRGARTSAVALRLEGLDGRWQCTAAELG